MSDFDILREDSNGVSVIPMDAQLLSDRKIYIDGIIDLQMAIDFSKKMMYLMREDEPIDIYISSMGGEVNAGLCIYDIIQSCSNDINMYCVGNACSMAAVLLASGQKGRRYILPHSKVMVHEVLVNGGIGGSATSISEISKSILGTRDIVNGILAEHTGKSIKEINKATSFDNYMTAEEAVKFGICDEIVNGLN